MRPRVYIAGPISKGDLKHNIEQAEAAFFELLKAGLAPFCPHWSCYSNGPRDAGGGVYAVATQTGGGGANHADWLGVDLEWVAASHACLRLPGESTGADQEVSKARELGIPVYMSVRDLLADFHTGCLERGPHFKSGPAAEQPEPPDADKKDTNPKDAIGCQKLPLDLLPDTAAAWVAMAHLHGAQKYGAWNWRAAGVRPSIYLAAMRRHLGAWWNGQDADPDSGLPHLAHVAACCNILLDADACGKLNDDRPPVAPVAGLQAMLNDVVKQWKGRAA